MKSIPYLLTGKPTRLDDCLDLAKNASSAPTVALSLKNPVSVRLNDILTQLVGIYRWTLGDKDVEIEVIYGGLFMLNEQSRSRTLEHANRRLAGDLSRLTDQGIAITGSARQFDESSCCSSDHTSFTSPAASCA
ncbi:MAG: hypothetical protein AB7E95_06705 [Kiritimatiellales bacterium]